MTDILALIVLMASCAAGLESDGGGGCSAVLPSTSCAAGTIAVLGATGQHAGFGMRRWGVLGGLAARRHCLWITVNAAPT